MWNWPCPQFGSGTFDIEKCNNFDAGSFSVCCLVQLHGSGSGLTETEDVTVFCVFC